MCFRAPSPWLKHSTRLHDYQMGKYSKTSARFSNRFIFDKKLRQRDLPFKAVPEKTDYLPYMDGLFKALPEPWLDRK